MAFEQKDLMKSQSPEEISKVGPGTQSQGLQLQISEEMERTLIWMIKDDYQSAKDARNDVSYGTTDKGEKINFDKNLKLIKDLYNAERLPKTTPWKFCSNRSLRIAASILDMLHARLLPSIVNEDFLRWRPGELNDVPKVERISKLMSWWVWIHCRMRSFFDNWVKTVIGFGDCLTETSWKIVQHDTGKTLSQPVTDEMGNPLTNPDGSSAMIQSREIRREEFSISKIYTREQVFLCKSSRDIKEEPVIIEEEFPYYKLEQGEVEGRFKNVSNQLKEKLKENSASFSGLIPEEQEIMKAIKMRNVPIRVLRWFGWFDADGDGFQEEVVVTIDPDHDIYLGGIPTTAISKSGKRLLNYTKFESRLERPEENDGIGILEKVRELALEIDAIFNQMTDANTLSILRPGFYDPAGDIDAPALTLAPNKITPVTAPQQNMFFPEMSVRTEMLINAIRLVLEFIERLTAASSYVLGKESEIVGGSGTATRTNAIMASAEQRFAIPAERLRNGAAEIIRQHLDILQKNIPPGLETRVLGEKGEPVFETNELTQEGIAGEFDAYMMTDPSMGSKQTERELASMFYSVLLQNVIVGTDPVKIYKVTSDLLRAYGKEPEAYLGPEPQSDMIDSPEDENTLILQGDFARVRAQITENHILHIKAHSDLLQSPSLAALPPHLLGEVQNYTGQHIMEHQQQMSAMMALMQKMGGAKGGIQGQNPGADQNPERNGNESRMEGIQGPLGSAMDQKRKGESSGIANR